MKICLKHISLSILVYFYYFEYVKTRICDIVTHIIIHIRI